MKGARPPRAWFGAFAPALAAGVFLAVLAAAAPGPLRDLGNLVFDTYQRLAPRPADPALPVRVVAIDDESLARIGQWPWPRDTLARLVEAIGESGARAIGLDILLSEPERTGPAGDSTLAGVLTRYPVAGGIVLADTSAAAPVRAAFATAGDDPAPYLPRFAGAIAPMPALVQAFRGFGALNWLPERDAVARRVPAVLAAGGRLVPALAMETLRLAEGGGTILVRSVNASGEPGLGAASGIISLRVGRHTIPTEADGAIRIRFADPLPDRTIPAWRVLAGQDKAAFSGRIVLVGASAAALADTRATPLATGTPGVEIHAAVIEQVLAGARLARPDWARGAEAVATLSASALVALAVLMLPPVAAPLAALVLAGGIGWAGWLLFRDAALLINPVAPVAATLAGFVIATLGRWRAADAERRAIRDAFAHYLAPALVDRLASTPSALRLGGEQRTITVLFADVRGFTGLAEAYSGDPEGLTTLMNRLLTPLSHAVLEADGTIDKFIGDAVMALWNAPLDVPDHEWRACMAALEMQRAMNGLNTARADRPALALGIGINTGSCVVGNMGSESRFDYSALGAPVNLAARLEQETRDIGLPILIGPDTARRVANRLAILPVGPVLLRGLVEAVAVHALVGDAALAATPAFMRLRDGLVQGVPPAALADDAEAVGLKGVLAAILRHRATQT